MLNGRRVLIVEDEPFTALAVADSIAAVGGEVVGPFAKVADALVALTEETVDAAILDANLIDRDVTPVALLLIARRVPFILHTGGIIPKALQDLHPHLPVYLKPSAPDMLVKSLSKSFA